MLRATFLLAIIVCASTSPSSPLAAEDSAGTPDVKIDPFDPKMKDLREEKERKRVEERKRAREEARESAREETKEKVDSLTELIIEAEGRVRAMDSELQKELVWDVNRIVRDYHDQNESLGVILGQLEILNEFMVDHLEYHEEEREYAMKYFKPINPSPKPSPFKGMPKSPQVDKSIGRGKPPTVTKKKAAQSGANPNRLSATAEFAKENVASAVSNHRLGQRFETKQEHSTDNSTGQTQLSSPPAEQQQAHNYSNWQPRNYHNPYVKHHHDRTGHIKKHNKMRRTIRKKLRKHASDAASGQQSLVQEAASAHHPREVTSENSSNAEAAPDDREANTSHHHGAGRGRHKGARARHQKENATSQAPGPKADNPKESGGSWFSWL